MNRSASGVTLVLLAVAAAALLGLAVIASPGVALPFSIELLLLLVLTVWGLSREPDLDLRRWLVRLALAALALRLLLVLVVQFRFSPYFFAPDAQAYERIGREISNYWSGEGFAPRAIREGWRPGYYHLNAVFYSAFGDSRLALVVINMFAGVWTALFTFYLTKEFLPVASAKVAALLTGVFPSLVLWSVLNIRDSLATLCTVMLVLYAIRLTKRFQPYDLWAFLGALLGLGLQGLHGLSRPPRARDRKRDRGSSGPHVCDHVVRYDRGSGVDLLGGSGGPVFVDSARRPSRDRADPAERTTTGCRLCVRRGSRYRYHRSGSPVHTDRGVLSSFRTLPLGYPEHASGHGDGRDVTLVSSFLALDSRVPNFLPRSSARGARSGVRASGRRVELCSGGGKLRDGVSASGPDHAALLHFFGHRALLDQDPGHRPDAVVADEGPMIDAAELDG